MSKVFVPPTGISDPNTTTLQAGALPTYRFVYFENAMSKGEIAQWSDSAAYLGYGVEDAVDYSTRVAGVVPQAQPAGFGFLQTGGYCDYITTDTNVAAPNADTVAGDIYLYAMNNSNAPRAVGATAAEFNALVLSTTDTTSVTAAFAMNLAADAAAVGTCILMCRVPGQ